MSQFATPSYEVDRPSGRCALTDAEILPTDAYYASLVEMTDQELAEVNAEAEKAGKAKNTLGLKRVDVCSEAWESGKRPTRLFSYWKTTQPEPNAKKKIFVDDTVLMQLLQRLEGETDPDKQAFRYVLALILMRKKLLRYDGLEHKDDGTGLWKVTPKKDVTKGHFGKWAQSPMYVIDPGLNEERVREVTEQLGEVLEGEV